MNESNEVSNVYGDISEQQLALENKAKALVAFLKEEPEAALVPKLLVNESGIKPDIGLYLVDNSKKETNETNTETGSEGVNTEGGDTTGEAESLKA